VGHSPTPFSSFVGWEGVRRRGEADAGAGRGWVVLVNQGEVGNSS